MELPEIIKIIENLTEEVEIYDLNMGVGSARRMIDKERLINKLVSEIVIDKQKQEEIDMLSLC